MPNKPKHPCRYPSCPILIPAGQRFCHAHQDVDRRMSAAKRGYNSRWRKLSKLYLKEHPLCVVCESHGRYTPATVVDHKVPHRGDTELFWDQSNWQALCKECHDYKTGKEDSHPVYAY